MLLWTWPVGRELCSGRAPHKRVYSLVEEGYGKGDEYFCGEKSGLQGANDRFVTCKKKARDKKKPVFHASKMGYALKLA
jgi:hypothetical protein